MEAAALKLSGGGAWLETSLPGSGPCKPTSKPYTSYHQHEDNGATLRMDVRLCVGFMAPTQLLYRDPCPCPLGFPEILTVAHMRVSHNRGRQNTMILVMRTPKRGPKKGSLFFLKPPYNGHLCTRPWSGDAWLGRGKPGPSPAISSCAGFLPLHLRLVTASYLGSS